MFRRRPHVDAAAAMGTASGAPAGPNMLLHGGAGASLNTPVQSAGSPARTHAAAARMPGPGSPLAAGDAAAAAAVATTGFAPVVHAEAPFADAAQRTANGIIVAGRYRLERTIGKGSYGKVKLATDLAAAAAGLDARVAVKFIAKASIRKAAHATRIHREINVLRALHHPGVVALHETLETESDIVLVMEHVSGADLYERIVAHPAQRYAEAEARPLAQQIVAAVAYCHAQRVVHRDLKPENVMVTDGGAAKLIDFGFANLFHPRGLLETNCGSPLYAAPEIVQGVRYAGPGVDVWSLGVVLFAMLTGTLPFEDEHLKGLYAKICAGSYSVPAYVSPAAADLLRSMLTVDPRMRVSIDDVARHPWIVGSGAPSAGLAALAAVGSSRASHAVCPAPREDVLRAMAPLGLADVAALRLAVRTDPDDPATAMYALLVAREAREARGQTGAAHVAAPGVPGVVALRTPPPLPLSAPRSAPALRVAPGPASAGDTPRAVGSAAASVFSSPGSIVSHAAATVASHFRRLRNMGAPPRHAHRPGAPCDHEACGSFFHVA